MVYISSSGTLEEKRSIFRLTIFAEVFWVIVNFIGLFFSSLFGEAKTGASQGGRYQPRRRPGGGGGGGGGGPETPGGRPPNRRLDRGTGRIGRVDCNPSAGGG
jgi:hypothetical protein